VPEKRPTCRRGIHFLDVPDATFKDARGISRCRECRVARNKKSRTRRSTREAKALERHLQREAARAAKEREAEAAREAAKPKIAPGVPRGLSRETAALHRHALIVRKDRGLM
jgi:hypothetical protein